MEIGTFSLSENLENRETSKHFVARRAARAQLCLDLEIQMVMIIVIKSVSRRTMQTNVAISSSIAILSFCCDFRMKPRHMWLGKPLFFGTKWDCHMKYLWIFLEKNKYSAHNSYVYEIGCSKSSEKIYSPHRNLNRIDEFWFRLFFFSRLSYDRKQKHHSNWVKRRDYDYLISFSWNP